MLKKRQFMLPLNVKYRCTLGIDFNLLNINGLQYLELLNICYDNNGKGKHVAIIYYDIFKYFCCSFTKEFLFKYKNFMEKFNYSSAICNILC
jgi:hypothetical protein